MAVLHAAGARSKDGTKSTGKGGDQTKALSSMANLYAGKSNWQMLKAKIQTATGPVKRKGPGPGANNGAATTSHKRKKLKKIKKSRS